VIHIGTSAVPGTAERCNTFLPPEYILFVREARTYYKNFQRFLRAVGPPTIPPRGPAPRNCLRRRRQIHGGRDRLFEQLCLAGRIQQYSAPDLMLWSLYKNARVFVFPSLYEGFGIPAIRSVRLRMSDRRKQHQFSPEIAGDAACYSDPLDESSIRQSCRPGHP